MNQLCKEHLYTIYSDIIKRKASITIKDDRLVVYTGHIGYCAVFDNKYILWDVCYVDNQAIDKKSN